MVRGTTHEQFDLTARNFDVYLAHPKYNFVALAKTTDRASLANITDLRVDFGDVTLSVGPGGQFGDREDRAIYFTAPFLAPPIMLLTARTLPSQSGSDLRAVHPVAHNVDQYGFTAMARSADHRAGTMTLSWIAFGCDEACGG
jgi:hypothetical protein